MRPLVLRRMPPPPPPPPLLEAKAAGTAIGTAALASAAASTLRLRVRGPSCDMLLEQILLGDQHGRLSFLLSHEAMRSLTRIDGLRGRPVTFP